MIDKLGENKKFIEIINTGTESKPYKKESVNAPTIIEADKESE